MLTTYFADLILKIVTQICADVLLTTHADALKKTIPFLIAKWIGNNYTISLFPWYFTRSSSSNDFLLDENETIAIAVLRNAPNLLPEYVQMMQAESLQSILRHHEVSQIYRSYRFPLSMKSTIWPTEHIDHLFFCRQLSSIAWPISLQ